MLTYSARMVATCLGAWREGRVAALSTVRTTHRAWPGDCDPNFHLNEGSYLKVAGLSRLALWVRMGLARSIVLGGLRPAAISSSATFHREIPPFARFSVASRLVTWDAMYLFFEHRFERDGRDAARVISRTVFRNAAGPVASAVVLGHLAHTDPAPVFPEELEHWSRMREAARVQPA